METINQLWIDHPILLIYFGVINIVTLFFYALDKIFAQSHAWRIRERTLFLLALVGGSVGAIAGMYIFRHKTRKLNFLIVFSLILLAQLAVAVALLNYYATPSQDATLDVIH